MSIHFVGGQNFAKAVHDPVFVRALVNNLVYAGLVIPFGVFLALGVALLVHRRQRSRAF